MIEPDFEIEEQEMTLEEVKAILEGFERQYGMTSAEFLEKWKKGETEWVNESVAWHGLFEAYQAHHSNSKNQAPATAETDFDIEEHDMTLDEVTEALKKYERRYGMTSQKFYTKWKNGETDFVAESVDWSLLFEAYQIMNGKAVS